MLKLTQKFFSSLMTSVLNYTEEPDSSRVKSGSSAYLRTGVGVCLFLFLFAIPVMSLAQTSAPATQANAEHLTATITAVRGLVQYRESDDQPWKPCTTGLVLGEGAEFRTGPRSNVQLLIPPQQTVTLDRLGSMTLLEAIQSSGKYTTDVGLKHGRVRYDIEAPGIEHESTVSSPNGTLAVRDTSFAVDDERPFEPEAYRLSGTVDFSTAKRTISMGGAIPGDVKATGDQNPADGSLAQAVVDPALSLSRTPSEVPLVADLLSRGAVFSEIEPKRIPIVSDSTPPSDTELERTLPGKLDFVVRWDGNANLDLGLISLAAGETLYPATGLNTSPSGGIIPFNNIGGPQGGIELAYWQNNYPKGLYEIIVNGVSGVPVNYDVNVFENGTEDNIFSSLSASSQGTPSLTGTIKAGQVVAGIVEVGGGSPVPPPAPTPPTVTSIRSMSVGGAITPLRLHR